MSWLLKSLEINDPEPTSSGFDPSPSPGSSPRNSGGLREELSVFGLTIGRQLRGVAEFLAPPPHQSTSSPPAAASDFVEDPPVPYSPSQALVGIRNDLVEIGGSVKSGLSRLSSNRTVAEISKFASNLLQFQNVEEEEEREEKQYESEEEEFDEEPGITEEVVDFVKEISTRPECWTDFPLSLDNDFEMSDAQREHALVIEQLVPGLQALRDNLHSFMEDVQFWMIYFIFLLPRLNEHDFELLATSKVVETRELLLQKMRKRRDAKVETSESSETEGVNDNVGGIVDATESLKIKENIGQSSGGTDAAAVGASTHRSKTLEDEKEISFSDLEDDDNDLSDKQSSVRDVHHTRASSPSGSNDWVQLNRSPASQRRGELGSQGKYSEGEESSDWFAVDDSE